MRTIQPTVALSVLFSLVVGLASPTQVKAQTWVQSAIAAAQAQAAEEPITNKTIPVVANPSNSPPGTYWSLQLADQPPLPDCPFPDLQVIEITNGIYLIDDRSVDYPGLWAELDDQVQSSATKNKGKSGGSMMDMAGGDSFDAFSYSSDQLYLEITNIADGLVYLNLDNATNEVYAVWSMTNLSTGWSVETDLWPTNPVTMPFTVQTLNRQNLFLRAEDWTGVTDNGNTTPNWWFWENFGPIWSTLYDTNVDSRGNTCAFDYQNGIDPNPIQFSIAPTNPYVNSSSVTVPLNIITGIPFGMAILIDSTNFATASWQSYNSNVAVTLGATNGAYDVWIGLRGHLTNTLQVWQGTTITFDTVPPTITITNPTTTVVSQPLIQLQGYASEPLSSFTYDLTNALGQVTNQTVFMISESPDTNAGNYTTSYFQGYDIPLTNGLNTITLHASDLAGNTTTTNLNFTLDYSGKTNAPTITISWPPSNSVFAGTNFTLSGSLSDDTASVTVTGFGGTNTAAVQRGGKFTVANLPLSNPTNTFTVTVTDVVGNSSSLQWTVFQSAASVTIDSLSAAALSQPLVTVTGTININNLDVWVNGVQATMTGGTWQANNVPVSRAAGTGEFDVSLYATGTTSPLVGAQSSVVELPPVIQAASYLRVYSFFNSGACGVLPDGTSLIENWQLGVGGRDVEVDYDEARGTTNITEYDFAPDSPIPVSPWQNVLTKDGDRGQALAWECGGTFTFSYATSDFQSTRLQLVAGGSADRSAQQLVRLTASFLSNGNTVPPSQVTSFGQVWTPTSTNSDVGELYVTLPAGATQDFTFSSSSLDNLSMVGAQAENAALRIFFGTNDVTDQTTSVIVGQQINLSCQLSITNATPTTYQWTVPGFTISNYIASATAGTIYSNFSTINSNVFFYWVNGASNLEVKCSVTVNNGVIPVKATFNVQRPLPTFYAQVLGNVAADPNYHNFRFDSNGNIIDGGLAGGNWLHFGILSSWSNIGIAFYFSNAPIDISGRYFLVQIVNGLHIKKNGTYDGSQIQGFQKDAYGLDTAYPFLPALGILGYWYTSDTTSGRWEDAPASTLDGLAPVATWLSRTDSYSSYLMFQPAVLTGSSIPVPIWSASWTWAGVANTNAVTGGYQLLSSSLPSPSIFQATNIPEWTVNATNFQYITNAIPFSEN